MGLTVERLQEILDYDLDTGVFRWRARSTKKAGKVAGCLVQGYLQIKADGKKFCAHRLAWLYVYGKWPALNLDHINRDPLDNRIANLREATQQQNTHNRRVHRTSRTGLKGVYPSSKNHFAATIMCSGIRHYLGNFTSREAAVAAHAEAARRLHGEFAT